MHLPDGTSQVIPHTPGMTGAPPPGAPPASAPPPGAPAPGASPPGTSVVDVPLPTPEGRQSAIDNPEVEAGERSGPPRGGANGPGPGTERVVVPLGRLCGARSGDKGGNANVGFWARDEPAYAWLRAELTVERLRELLTEGADLEIRRFELPNLRALNFVIIGLIAPGVAATTRPDAQAKGLGEYLRSRYVLAPAELVRHVPGRH